MMKKLIAYCGLDCEKCDARKATLKNDDALREKTARLWSKMNGEEILPEMINCEGCRADGVETPFCSSLCQIRQCALGKGYETCGDCVKLDDCQTISMIISTNAEALENLNDVEKKDEQ